MIKKDDSIPRIIYRYTIKPLLNIITLRIIRKSIVKFFYNFNNKKIVREIESTFSKNTVLIFQQKFFDLLGEECFNGGAERYMQDLSEILIKKNLKPVLVQMSDKKYWKKQVNEMLIVGLPSIIYNDCIKRFTKYKFVIYSGACFWGEKILHPNILISHGITWDVVDKNANIKTIYDIFKNIDNIVSVDTNTISWLRTTFAKSMHKREMKYIPNYVDTSIYKPNKKENKHIKIIFPRRASDERGYWLMSKVLPHILEKYPNIEFDFVGFTHGKAISNDIKHLIRLFPERIRNYMVGPDSMVNVYQEADISVIPTLYAEGTSLSCLEAQACGNTVVATNIGGLPNLIINGYNGLLINPNEKELETSISSLVENQELRKSLSKNAIDVAKSFDKSIWIHRWEQLINELLNKI